MAIGINDVDLDDDLMDDSPSDVQTYTNESSPSYSAESDDTEYSVEQISASDAAQSSNDSDYYDDSDVVDSGYDDDSSDGPDVLTAFLQSKGIEDPNRIKFTNPDGQLEEVSWNDLNADEQYNILQGYTTEQPKDDNTSLDDTEIDLINRLRLSNMTPQELIRSAQMQGAQQYAQSVAAASQPNYTVDDLSDDELYVLDMQARIEDVTDDELRDALEKAKDNEELYQKEVRGLREEYKRMEDERNYRQQAAAQQQQAALYQNFTNNIAYNIDNLNTIGELDVAMDNDDKDEIYNFITGYDNAGISYLGKALNDPETLVKMAWFALKGEDVINSISDYYKNEVRKANRSGYERGYYDASPKPSRRERQVVVSRPTATRPSKRIKSIDDLD